MKLSIYNGSPRGAGSNSKVFADMLTDGFGENHTIAQYFTKDISKHDEIIKDTAESYFIVFPLYADTMPYGMKVFLEKMEENKKIYAGKPIYFFIHSGFPEAKQSRLLERYLKYFCKVIDAECKGVCIMGNSEGVRHIKKDSKKYAKLQSYFNAFADDMINGRAYNEEGIKYFHVMETLPPPAVFIFKNFPGVFNMGFDMMIKKKGAYDKRFDRPYA